MAKHTDLAKNILPNSSQGRARINQLWEHLTTKLNASGPPIKDSKIWRKVYADQKQNVKKKLSSKKRTGGGPYEEKVLTTVEEQIIVAAGIDAAVEGLKTVPSFGPVFEKSSTPTKGNDVPPGSEENNNTSCQSNHFITQNNNEVQQTLSSFMEIEFDVEEENLEPTETLKQKVLPKIRKKGNKTDLLEKNIMSVELYHQEMLKRLDKLVALKEEEVDINNQMLEIKKTKLKMREMEHELTMQIKAMEFKMRKKELQS